MGPKRPLSAGENPGSPALPNYPSEDPNAMNPRGVRNPMMNVPRVPWYAAPPGGPRFSTGVPSPQFQVTPFDHVVRGHGHPPAFRTPMGNTGFGDAGAVSEETKTALTGVFLLASVALLFVVYGKKK